GDSKRAKDWKTKRKSGKMSGGPLINIQNSTVSGSGTIYGGTTNAETSNIDMSKKRYYEKEKGERKVRTKRTKTDSNVNGKINEFFSPVSQRDQDHENMKNNHVNEEPTVTLKPFVPEEELEENLLQENPGATVDFKLIIDNICIRSEMEKWHQTSKYIEEIHKQDLLCYNIIDTISSSGTKARGLFKHQWDDIISNIEKFLVSPDTTPLSSDFDPISDSDNRDMEQDGRASNISQYLTKILKNVNTAKRLCDTIMTERKNLRAEENTKWKKRSLDREQFPNGRNLFKEEQTEYDYIIRGEKTLCYSAILLNRSLKDDNRRCFGNKIDAIMSILDIGLEFSTLEVSGSPSKLDHTHYAGDRNKTAKMLKIILNYIYIKYPGDFEKFRKIKVYGVQIYDHNLYVYSICMPFAGIYYFKLEKMFSYPTITFLVFKEFPIFASNLWMLRGLITSSFNSIMTYITSNPLQIDNDNTMIANVEVSPPQKKNYN
ncbi:2175_t:CDS:2, partial [Funneliformis mosseae]